LERGKQIVGDSYGGNKKAAERFPPKNEMTECQTLKTIFKEEISAQHKFSHFGRCVEERDFTS